MNQIPFASDKIRLDIIRNRYIEDTNLSNALGGCFLKNQKKLIFEGHLVGFLWLFVDRSGNKPIRNLPFGFEVYPYVHSYFFLLNCPVLVFPSDNPLDRKSTRLNSSHSQ